MFELVFRPSYLVLLFLILIHLCAGIALCLTELPVYLLVVSLLILGLCGTVRIKTELPQSSSRVLRARVSQQWWILESRQGDRQYLPPAALFVSEVLIVLQFSQEINAADPQRARPLTLVICPDSLSAAQSRRLRRYLRFECAEASP